jgi:hypothetical protein
MIIVMCIATFSSTMMCEAMSRIPGNEKFQVTNFSSHSNFCPGQNRAYHFVQILLWQKRLLRYNFPLCHKFTSNEHCFYHRISSGKHPRKYPDHKTMDYTIMAIFRTTCAVEVYPHPSFLCVHNDGIIGNAYH